ncbi:hypothetical protein PIB30_041483 [Stylosanthes scabra]|uniref:Uncharacterized protein n=1 Tax=Stylosanthes scabra TaxID=79078 RepID=A0ABU6SF79_9FABA|nr:hypothetical protein [Stylosanthes scabra]
MRMKLVLIRTTWACRTSSDQVPKELAIISIWGGTIKANVTFLLAFVIFNRWIIRKNVTRTVTVATNFPFLKKRISNWLIVISKCHETLNKARLISIISYALASMASLRTRLQEVKLSQINSFREENHKQLGHDLVSSYEVPSATNIDARGQK